MRNLYATLDDFKTDADITPTVTTFDAAILRWLEGACRVIDNYTHRTFMPFKGTLGGYIDDSGRRILLDEDIVSLESWTADGLAVASAYNLLPLNASLRSRPYNSIYLTDGSSFYPVGFPIEYQITGVFGWPEDARPISAVITGQTDSETALTVATGTVPIGALLKIEDEYQEVTARTTGAPNDTLTVTRGANGTTAVAHGAVTIYRLHAPMAVEIAAIAHASRIWKRRKSAWSNVAVNSDLGTMELFKGLDADVKLMLDEYVKYSV